MSRNGILAHVKKGSCNPGQKSDVKVDYTPFYYSSDSGGFQCITCNKMYLSRNGMYAHLKRSSCA